MSEKAKEEERSPHWLRPLRGKWRVSRHLLVWPEEKERRGRIVCDTATCFLMELGADGQTGTIPDLPITTDSVAEAIDASIQLRGTLTVWLPAGWEHLVMTGLTGAIDAGVLTWRYLSFEGERLMLRGLWRGRPIVICSLANWTGGRWDEWRDKCGLEGIALFREGWRACASVSYGMSLGSLAPSAAAAGLLLWRSWLGPRLKETSPAKRKGKNRGPGRTTEYVAPVPSRPLRARQAERHCAYGLICRHLRRGLVEGPIYAVDVSAAYLLYLMTMPIPIQYQRTLHKPTPLQLSEALDGHTGCALVQIYSPADPYPCRRNGRVLWATGNYWTWLAGTELASALTLSHVLAVESAFVWSAQCYAPDKAARIVSIGDQLKHADRTLEAAAWRSVYSQLVGRFAGWRRVWEDCTSRQQFGPWAAWLEADPKTGLIVPHRSIAGRVQRMTRKTDTSDSVPLLFGCVTAQGRWFSTKIAAIAGRGNVICIEADALWLTAAGWQALQRRLSQLGTPPDHLRCKEVYDRAWMSGERISLVQIGDKKYLRCPGVPADVAVGAAGRVEWPSSADWHTDGEPKQERGVRRSQAHYSVERILRDYGGLPVELPWGDVVDDPMMGAELLEPLGGGERTVDDEE